MELDELFLFLRRTVSLLGDTADDNLSRSKGRVFATSLGLFAQTPGGDITSVTPDKATDQKQNKNDTDITWTQTWQGNFSSEKRKFFFNIDDIEIGFA